MCAISEKQLKRSCRRRPSTGHRHPQYSRVNRGGSPLRSLWSLTHRLGGNVPTGRGHTVRGCGAIVRGAYRYAHVEWGIERCGHDCMARDGSCWQQYIRDIIPSCILQPFVPELAEHVTATAGGMCESASSFTQINSTWCPDVPQPATVPSTRFSTCPIPLACFADQYLPDTSMLPDFSLCVGRGCISYVSSFANMY